MNPDTPTAADTPASQPEILQAARARWAALAQRERQALQALAWLLGAALLWAVALAPAWRTLQQAPAQQLALDEQILRMQAMAREAQQLRELPQVSAAQTQAALSAAVARLGDAAQLQVQGERAVLRVQDLPGTELLRWLQEVRLAAKARPVQVQLQRSANGYSGTLTLSWEQP
ncbi:type II secretion system protein GspM [Roseateles sp. BYS180W]|uniref:Type II secretion system protein GspM n=1 Tax=Roseateles rivi TaxID=3299028 RepID=A0ABW7FRG2_9BURK